VLQGAIAAGDVATPPMSASAKKTAERLVIELKGFYAPASGASAGMSVSAAAPGGEVLNANGTR